MPCSRPLIINEQTVACRSCDYCVGRRVRSWCHRAMMEKATSPHTFVVALTYNEETEHSRRSAQMFDYQDVSDFIKRLRRRMDYHLKAKGALSFIAAGEQGDRYGRCHWHIVLFGSADFLSLGEWKGPWGVVTEKKDIVSPVTIGAGQAKHWNRSWDLWPHGFVVVQEPDYGGMRYALAYALKDQFNVRNTQGTARQGKAEVFGTGYLAMSKKPPIGARFIDDYLAQCRSGNYVPPSRKLTIPGVTYPWWPTGIIAERLLVGLAEINREIKTTKGKDAAGWSSLLYEARQSDDDLERLGVFDGEEIDEADELRQISANLRDNSEQIRVREIRRRCGSTEACSLCLRGHSTVTLEKAGIFETPTGFARYRDIGSINANGYSEDAAGFAKHQHDAKGKGPNPLCCLYADPLNRASDYATIFPASAFAEFASGVRAGS